MLSTVSLFSVLDWLKIWVVDGAGSQWYLRG